MLAAAALLLASSGVALAPEQEQILDVLDRFFVALERADTDAFKTVIEEEATLTSLRPGEDGLPQTRAVDRDTFLAGLEGLEGVIVELYWEPTVMVSPVGLAQAWVPYVVEANGKRVHCGVDNFTLIKRQAGWVITGLDDTRDPASCERLGLEPHRAELRPVTLRPLLKN